MLATSRVGAVCRSEEKSPITAKRVSNIRRSSGSHSAARTFRSDFDFTGFRPPDRQYIRSKTEYFS
jgi:hypothetical protein